MRGGKEYYLRNHTFTKSYRGTTPHHDARTKTRFDCNESSQATLTLSSHWGLDLRPHKGALTPHPPAKNLRFTGTRGE